MVERLMRDKLSVYLKENPAVAKVIFEKALARQEQERLQEKQGKMQEENLRLTPHSFRVSLPTVSQKTAAKQKSS